MKEKINIMEYARQIQEALPKGILLNTNCEKFDTMVIGWGAVGFVWGLPAVTVYVRESRYTKEQLDKTGEFTVSIPLGMPLPEITKICGTLSGRDIDKVKEARLTLEEPEKNHTPGIKEYPLTLECKVLYDQAQDLSRLPEKIRERMYPQNVPGTEPLANRDPHTAYIGQIVSAYIIK
ncbi:MAG: flavin reductase [Firmicutes bacterium]|nr:flavin reductase [Bacillota bacterium]